MKTRPHIVTQTQVYDTSRLQRTAGRLADCMGPEYGASVENVLGYGRVLIRLMKIILDLALHNDCFIVRRDVLASPKLRQRVMEQLGGAHALLKWRRRKAWNTGRLAAIASGEYRPAPEPDLPAASASPLPEGVEPTRRQAKARETPSSGPGSWSAPAQFCLPVLQNLRYVHHPRPRSLHRAKPQKRFLSVVLWPHELDGQYVPGFKSRAVRPGSGGFARSYQGMAARAGSSGPAVFAPP